MTEAEDMPDVIYAGVEENKNWWISEAPFRNAQTEYVRADLVQPVDVEALKIDYNNLSRCHEDYDYSHGYNAALDHITSEYDIIKKVK